MNKSQHSQTLVHNLLPPFSFLFSSPSCTRLHRVTCVVTSVAFSIIVVVVDFFSSSSPSHHLLPFRSFFVISLHAVCAQFFFKKNTIKRYYVYALRFEDMWRNTSEKSAGKRTHTRYMYIVPCTQYMHTHTHSHALAHSIPVQWRGREKVWQGKSTR